MQRRSFLAGLTAGIAGLWLPGEPSRVYSFIRPVRRAPVLRIFAGSIPLDADTAITNVMMLSEISLSKIGDAWRGTDHAADNSGVASFARLYGAYGETVLDLRGEAMGLNSRHISAASHVSMELRAMKLIEPMLVG